MRIYACILIALLLLIYASVYAKVFCLLFMKKLYLYRGIDNNGIVQFYYVVDNKEYVFTPKRKRCYYAQDGILVYIKDPNNGIIFKSFRDYNELNLAMLMVIVIAVSMLLFSGRLVCFIPVLIIEAVLRQTALLIREYYTMKLFACRYIDGADIYDSLAVVYRKPEYKFWWYKTIRCVLLTWFVLALFVLWYDPNILTTTREFSNVKDVVLPIVAPKYLKDIRILTAAIKSGSIVDPNLVRQTIIFSLKSTLCMIYALSYPLYIWSRNYTLYCIYNWKYARLTGSDKDVKGTNT